MLKNVKKDWLYVLMLFIISAGVRTILSYYHKVIYTYGDELYYYQIAENFAHGKGIPVVYNEKIRFYKVLYSISISPAFTFGLRSTQRLIVALLNSIYMSSAIFPVYLLSKKILTERKFILLICVFFCLFPDLTLTMTFMSEILILPIATWLLYFYFVLFYINKKKSYLLASILGVFTYIGYLCKEWMPVMIPAYIVVSFFYHKKENIKAHIKEIKKICVLIISFLMSYLLTRYIIFGTDMSSYTGKTDINILDWEHILYFGFCILYYFTAVIVAYCFFVIIIPLLTYKQLDTKTRLFAQFIWTLLIMIILGCIYSTNLREDFTKPVPILHFRYFTFLWIPLLILFFKTFETELVINFKKLFGVIIFVSVMLFLVLTQVLEGSTVDHLFLEYISQKPNVIVFAYKIVFIIAMVIGFVLIKINKKMLLFRIICISLLGLFMVDSTIDIYHNINRKSISSQEYKYVSMVEDFIKNNDSKKFLIIRNGGDNFQRSLDTYCNYDNVYTANYKNLLELQTKSGIDFKKQELHLYFDTIYDQEIIDYIILQKTQKDMLDNNSYKVIIENEWYKVVELNNSGVIPYLILD